MPVNLADYEAAPFNGPLAQHSQLLPTLTAAVYEGLWLPSKFLKNANILVNGTFSAAEVDIFVSNDLNPPANNYVVTVGGTATSGDSVGLAMTAALCPKGTKTPAYTVQMGDNLNAVATGLAAAIAADTDLAALGITATALAAVVTIAWPSQSPAQPASGFSSPSQPAAANALSIATALSGGATETLAIALGTSGFKTLAITAVGLFNLATVPRWIKARLASFTGTSITADLNGAG